MTESKNILTTERTHGEAHAGLFAQLMQIQNATGGSFVEIASEYMKVATGPGSVSPEDFMHLRLFDKTFYGEADRREFVGEKKYQDICRTINYRRDWLGMLFNKVASMSYLNAYGLPTIPIKAIYAPKMGSSDSRVLSDKSALENFLLKPEMYPLFGKPIESQNSLGSVALVNCSRSSGEITMSSGERIKASDLATEIDAQYSAGYLFQNFATPHPAISALCGKRLATVRFLTIQAEEGVEIFRTCWKIPSGGNVADNYWRSGNLLARIDIANGRVLRVTSGEGMTMQEHTEHPDTKMPLVGFVHPQWDAMKSLALQGAKLMRAVPLIGWDIACTDTGPVIVEMNEYPDSFLMQFSDRRGLLDETFKKFIAFQKREREVWNANTKMRTIGM